MDDFDKMPKKKPFKVQHKISRTIHTMVCVHDPKSEKFGFSDLSTPFDKLIPSSGMREKFNLL